MKTGKIEIDVARMSNEGKTVIIALGSHGVVPEEAVIEIVDSIALDKIALGKLLLWARSLDGAQNTPSILKSNIYTQVDQPATCVEEEEIKVVHAPLDLSLPTY